jgi:hypothetical protein
VFDDDRREIGRIMWTHATSHETPWFWTIPTSQKLGPSLSLASKPTPNSLPLTFYRLFAKPRKPVRRRSALKRPI